MSVSTRLIEKLKREKNARGHKEEQSRLVGLVGQDGGEADTGVVPSASLRAGSIAMEILVACAACLAGAVSVDAMARLTMRARRLMSKWIRSPG